ncbi:coiled-coil domain-containing protein 22 [Folsomia candida]|uniref:Coiled-coil domain-containing protein 22 homolog n=1 Tax=Folsomia candida TaxID=158441 RepID=A0A226E383_FOLCA|nr:coiled-coil domain-containing protein 22 [Folsomia candida]OXA51730.1 Coiled-coil domain-containing protein 22 [Folsomia candida]
MDEVDGILIYTLKHIGCEIGSKVSELSPPQFIQCVTKCLQLSRPDADVPDFDCNVSMAVRYKVASQIAQLITDIGYSEEIGCQSFLYPTEEETRKILIFMVEKLPRDSEVGDQIETLLSKIAVEKASNQFTDGSGDGYTNGGLQVDGIKLPIAVDVDSLPKETLKFYASHLADLTFEKQREKYRNKVDVKPVVPHVIKKEDSDDDFGDPDIPEEEKHVILEKPKLLDKPKIKPAIPEKPKIDNKKEIEIADKKNREEEERAAAEYIKGLQEKSKSKAKLIKEKEKNIRDLTENSIKLQQEINRMHLKMNEKSKQLERLHKMDQLLSGDDALGKVKHAVDSQVEKLTKLSQQWEIHRQPLIDRIRNKKSVEEMSEADKIVEEGRHLKATLKLMGQEARNKEAMCNKLLIEYEKLPKDLSRSSYTRRIGEIIGNIKKQKKEIAKVLGQTKEIQKDINTLSGRLDRTFAVADELIFKVADKDKNVAHSYKLLVAIHSDFSRIIKTLEEIGNLKRQQRQEEDKLEFEKGKSVEDKLNRLKADMAQMQHENRILEAKLRNPTLKRNTQ